MAELTEFSIKVEPMSQKYCPDCNHVVTNFTKILGDELFDPETEESLGRLEHPWATCICGWQNYPTYLLKEPKLMAISKLKYVSIDIETTGLDPDTCQVLELGAVIEDWVSPIDKLPTFRYVVKSEQVTGTPFALALNADLLKLISNPPVNPPYLVGAACDLGWKFAIWLQGHGIDPAHVQAAGKNFASFDAQFLKKVPAFSHAIHFKHRTIDPCMLFWRLDDEELPDTKTCMKRSEIDGKVAHTAVEDAIGVVKQIRFWANTA